jgi:hypothetical protein
MGIVNHCIAEIHRSTGLDWTAILNRHGTWFRELLAKIKEVGLAPKLLMPGQRSKGRGLSPPSSFTTVVTRGNIRDEPISFGGTQVAENNDGLTRVDELGKEKIVLPEEFQERNRKLMGGGEKPYDPAKRKRISRDEWFAISSALEEHHAVFYKVWQMGKPHFTEEIETAAVQFDDVGEFIYFHFNPKFWDSLDFYNKLFVICHESLHVILNHGIRTREIERVNRGACNAALDVVVNHALLRSFGFEREKIINQEKLCWIDTVFAGRKPLPPDDEMYEFYYNLFEKVCGDGGRGDGSEGDGDPDQMGGMSNGQGTVDDHSFMGKSGDEWGKVIDKLQEGLSDEEKNSLKKMVEKHFQKGVTPKEALNQKAGTGTGGQWVLPTSPRSRRRRNGNGHQEVGVQVHEGNGQGSRAVGTA